MFVKNNFSWQKITEVNNLQLTIKFNTQYDIEQLQKETNEIFIKYSAKEQYGSYHKGGWNGICLHSANGDYTQDKLLKNAKYQKTEVLKSAPYIESIIRLLECDKLRIRIMELQTNKNIYWHYDGTDSLDEVTARLHIPIYTNPKVLFQISHENCYWKEGELWYGDFSFPHRLFNGWDKNRVHIIMDLVVNDKVKKMFPYEYVQLKEKRLRIKKQVHNAFAIYNGPRKVIQAIQQQKSIIQKIKEFLI